MSTRTSQNEKDRFVLLTWQQHSSHPKSCHAAAFPYLMVKALALRCLRWATAHTDWIQSPDFGNKQCWNTVLSWFDLFSFCPLLSLSVSCCRCERMWRWPVRREGSLHQLLRFLHLSVLQWLQPGDHAEQEVLSRWVALNDSNGHGFRKTTQTVLCFLLGHLKILSVSTIQ